MITLKNICRTLCAICTLTLVGCVDESYRVDKVSTEVTICQDKTVLPIGYFESKTLGDLLGDQILTGLEKDDEGNYSFIYEGAGEPIEFEGISSEFTIPEISSSFEVDYPEFNFEMTPIIIEQEEDIDQLSGLDTYITQGYIPAGIQLPTIKGNYTFEFGGDDLHVAFDLPEQIKGVNKVIFRDVESGHHGAPMHINVALNGLKDINAGGKLKFDLTIEGGKFRILDANNSEICNGNHYTENIPIVAGAETIDFVIYVESLTNTTEIDNHHLDIPLTLKYDMDFEIDTKSGYFDFSNKPHIELFADFEYGDADVSLNDEVDLIACTVANSPIKIDGLPKELVAVNSVNMKQGADAALSFYATGLNWLGDVANDLLVEVELPSYLAMHTPDNVNYKYNAQTHTLQASVADLAKGVTMGIDALDFGEGKEPNAEGAMELAFEPTVRVHFDKNTNVDVSKLIHDNFEIKVGIAEAELAIESVSGRLDYSYQVNQEFALTGLEDINLEIVGLGLKPVFEINITHPLTMDINLVGSITPTREGADVVDNTIEFKNVTIPGAKFEGGRVVPSNVKLIIADESLRANYSDSKYTFVACDVAKLINGTLPETLEIDLLLGVDSTNVETLHIPDELCISYDYCVDIPLALGSDFEIRYADEVEGLSPTFKALGNLDITVGDVVIIATVTNSTPLQLGATATLKNKAGEKTAVQLAIEDGAKILGSDDGVTAKQSVIRFVIDLGEAHNLSAIAEVDAIEFELVGTSAAQDGAVGLSLDQEIGVELQLELTGGVTIDINETLVGQK
ncbi:MAG: hypothetical protein IKV29_07545 [Alistipes sp.]|nr:hypothetical protein [Alistipes sp.]